MCINGNTQKDGKHISWTHLNALYDKSRFSSGLSLIPKLKKEHLHLNSYSRMRVSLAAQVRNLHGTYMIDLVLIISIQVLSTSVANGFDFYGLEETKETEKFVRMFDKFFDCLNVRCTSAGVHHRKPDLRPYRSPDDPRLKVSILLYHLMYNNSEINTVHLQWLKDDFLGYLDQWNDSVKGRQGFTPAQKQMMQLSRETLEGLRVTGIKLIL